MEELLVAWKHDERVKSLGLAAKGFLIEMALFLEESGPVSEEDAYCAVCANRTPGVPRAELAALVATLKSAGLIMVSDGGALWSPILTQGSHAREMVEVWNRTVSGVLPLVGKMTEARRRQADKRLLEDFHGSLDKWRAVVEQVCASPFLCGVNITKWRATFDWLLNPRNLAKVIEGNYDKIAGEAGHLTPHEQKLKEWILKGRRGPKPT